MADDTTLTYSPAIEAALRRLHVVTLRGGDDHSQTEYVDDYYAARDALIAAVRAEHRETERQARYLASYAASVNWQPGDNTREWLLGLRDLIEHVEALTDPNPGEMSSDLDLSHLEEPDEQEDGA